MRLFPARHPANLAIFLFLVAGLAASPATQPCAMAEDLAAEPPHSCCCCDPARSGDHAAPGAHSGAPMKGCGDAPCSIGPAASPDPLFLPTTVNLPGPQGDQPVTWVSPHGLELSAHPQLRNTPLLVPFPGDTPRYLTLSVFRS